MRAQREPAGATLVELIVAFSLIAILGGLGMPRVRAATDVYAVRAARDAAAAAVARARALAPARGGARVVIEPATGTLRIEAPIGTAASDPLRLAAGLSVIVSVDNHGATAVGLDFDALGIGRLANRTIRFRRGDAEARLTLSSFGRPRRW